MSTRQNFPYTTFKAADGTPLRNGSILLAIDDDVQAPDGSICRGMTVLQLLDNSGVVVSVPQVWANADLLPAGSHYILSAYTANGELASGPEKIEV